MSAHTILSRAHRDALYSELLNVLGETHDLEGLRSSGLPADITQCQQIGRRLTDALRLIQDGGLGWGFPDTDEAVELTLPPDELRRIMESLRRLLVVHQEANRSDRDQTKAEWQQATEARAACTAVIEQIGEEVASSCP
jgi:hypothetical protein